MLTAPLHQDLLINLSICFSHVRPLSNVSARYLTSVDGWIDLLKTVGSFSPLMPLLLVIDIHHLARVYCSTVGPCSEYFVIPLTV
jgi:hypothetical protein